MGNTSFYNNPPDTQEVEQTAATTSDEQRLTTFYQDGMVTDEGDAGSLLDELRDTLEECKKYRDECKEYRDQCQAIYDAFLADYTFFVERIYCGGYSTSPETNPVTGNALAPGVLYYDTVDKETYAWDGAAWVVFASKIGPVGKIGPAGIPAP